LPLLFEYLQAFCLGSAAEVYIVSWVCTVLCLSHLKSDRAYGFAFYCQCRWEWVLFLNALLI